MEEERTGILIKEKMPLVTVVTLSYKRFEYIYETIDSVLEQDYPYIQYIISDDGSPNCPLSDIEEYINIKKRENIVSFKMITRKENVGTVKNINLAYEMAIGEFLLPLSADDVFFDKTIVRKIVECFLKSNADVLCTSRILTDNLLKPIRYIPYKMFRKKIMNIVNEGLLYKSFIMGNYYEIASGSCTYLRTDFWKQSDYFDESYILWEDGPFFTEYTKRGGKIHFNYELVSIYYRQGGVSNGSIHPLLAKDMIYYNKVYRNILDGFSFFERRQIEFFTKQCLANFEKKQFNYWEYPDILIKKIILKAEKKIAAYIEKIL